MHEYGFLSLLPAILAIGFALWTKNVILSLFSAVVLGALIFVGGNPIDALSHTADTLLLGSVADADHSKIVLFSLFVGGMVGIVSRGKGTAALVGAIARLARTRRSAQTMTWLSGLLVFFDDYANCLIVGSTMRPVCDRMRVSRAKLAYLVDSTAAPVATLALVSTWVGFEVGVMKEGLEKVGVQTDAYAFFLKAWPYSFYPILAFVMVGAVALMGRDFGPMWRAETRFVVPDDEDASGSGNVPRTRILLAALPVLTLLVLSLVLMYVEGKEGKPDGAPLFEILGNADGLGIMVKSSLMALLLAGVLAFALGALKAADVVKAAIDGMKELFEALAVLYLAWALGAAMGELHAADYLVSTLQTALPEVLLPTVVFVVAAVTAFATGTSFGTMAIFMPMVIPLAFSLTDTASIQLAASASVLAGACFGDHCSPISDTTVLSSLGARCDHVEHVRTQMPYALAVAGVAIVLGTLPSGFGVPVWATLPASIAGVLLVVRFAGRRTRG